MKVLLICVLAGSFFIEPTGSLRCYTCNTQVNNANCQAMVNCEGNAKACKTDVVGVVGLFNVISKECSSDCEPYFKDFTVGKRNISCCAADLCNVNGAQGFGTNYKAQASLALFTSLASLLLRS
ncbi:prostate stem cell antigen [Anolis carolinensis]|uniref:Prostate stem cell antigen n=1 Tax=Anolis carolinensis TaxID=28377 RepID=A0A803TLH1_ANOCA|nr:PREDICTED: prostate stem cell antigen isoform X2 [Anolis carolinensis]XP_008113707.1 PREDICTED: prostate stem cell antigen isoform X2 [Anolis carolinensis]XP_016850913.1 PREDICTED: prostate stem cell antigen isoform X2 [Anolis carolinensis]|eukprot:XP_003223978.1 PREDICTED: prostate stem cell antigen isoform X2 [Anolis carolinensis]